MPRENNYEFVRLLGHGGMATVELWRHKYPDILARKRQNSRFGLQKSAELDLVVAKRVFIGECTREEEDCAQREVQALASMEHPHIVKYFFSWKTSGAEKDLIIVQEYCEGGDLAHLIKNRREQKSMFPVSQVLRWFAQVAHALQYSHKVVRMLHRDLKPNNIFLSNGNTIATLGDFGIAKQMGSTKSLYSTFIGTQVYMSPDALKMQKYSSKCDVWSLGVTIYETLALERPFSGSSPLAVIEAITGPNPAPPIPPDVGCPEELATLVSRMLEKDDAKRPTLSQLLRDSEILRQEVLKVEEDICWPKEESLVLAADDVVMAADGLRPATADVRLVSKDHGLVGCDLAREACDPSNCHEAFHSGRSGCSGHAGEGDGPPSPPLAAPLVTGSAFAGGPDAKSQRIAARIASGLQPPPPPPSAPPRWGAQKFGLNISSREGSPSRAVTPGTEQMRTQQDSEKTIEAFKSALGTTHISREQLGDVFQRLNPSFSSAQLDTLLSEVGQSENGFIDYSKFVRWLASDSAVAVAARRWRGSPAPSEREQPSLDACDRRADALLRAALREADKARSLMELAIRREELEEVVAQVPLPEVDLATNHPCEPNSSVDVKHADDECNSELEERLRNLSDSELQEIIAGAGCSADGCRDRAELQERAFLVKQQCPEHRKVQTRENDMQDNPAHVSAELRKDGEEVLGSAGATLDSDLQHTASVISARLQCIAVLQSKCPDPEELTAALREVKELGLGEEECGQALLVHSHRLRLQAETTLAKGNASLEDIEQAAEMLEAVQQDADVPKRTLRAADERLLQEQGRQRKVGVRTVCGPSVKFLSVPLDADLQEVRELIANRWGRDVASLALQWKDGEAVGALHNQEQWRRCVQAHPGRSIEVVLPALAVRWQQPVRRAQTSLASDARRTQTRPTSGTRRMQTRPARPSSGLRKGLPAQARRPSREAPARNMEPLALAPELLHRR